MVELIVGGRSFDLRHSGVIFGILNRTPDSFFDKGRYFALDDLLQRAESLVDSGADVLDIGGVKAGPGADVTEAEELDRVIPAVVALKERFDIALSVDTWRAGVLGEALSAGAVVGNDISGFADPEYLPVAARHGAAVVATHIRLRPRVADPSPAYDDLEVDVTRYLLERARRAVECGIQQASIMLDAGFDLGKTTEQSLALLGGTSHLVGASPLPVFISASNKGFLGETLHLEVGERREASLAAVSLGWIWGARIFRVHDVKGTRRVLDTLRAVADPTTVAWPADEVGSR